MNAWKPCALMVVAACLTLHTPAAAQQTVAEGRNATDDLAAAKALLARPITVSFDTLPLARAVDAVSAIANVRLMYQRELTDASPKHVTVHASKTPLGVVLETMLDGTGLTVVPLRGGQLALIERGNDAMRQQASGTIVGHVTDEHTAAPLRNVNVVLDDTLRRATTDGKGTFRFVDVPVGSHHVVVRFIGYTRAVRAVMVRDTSVTMLNIALAPAATVLAGVVTTATGVQRRLDVGSDITTINVDSVMRAAPIKSVSDLLDSRVPGMTVLRSSGTPGDPSRLRLRRGSSILESNDPIVIVDGIQIASDKSMSADVGNQVAGSQYMAPSALDQIDPSSIEKIEVFKGPSASAMYGSNAANGVIVITTKHGRPGSMRWSMGANVGVNSLSGDYPTYNFSFGHAVDGNGSPGTQCLVLNLTPCIIDSVVAFQALNDPRYTPFKRGGQQSLDGTVSGGTSALTYSLHGRTSNEDGIVRLPAAGAAQYLRFVGEPAPSWMSNPALYQTYAGDGTVSATLTPTATVTVGQSVMQSTQQRSSLDANSVSSLIGAFIDTTNLGRTPLLNQMMERATSDEMTSRSFMTADWTPRSWGHVSFNGGVDNRTRHSKAFVPSGLPSILFGNPQDSTGSFSVSKEEASTKTANVGASVSIPLPWGRTLTVATGINVVQDADNEIDLQTFDLPVGVTNPSTFNNGTNISQTDVSTSTYGWYVEPQLHLSDRFTVSPGIRLDGGSATGSHAGLTVLPKINFSWLLIDHSGGTGLWQSLVSTFRLRGAYGMAGVQPDPAARLRLYSAGSVIVDGWDPVYGVTPFSPGNTTIRPERSSEIEGGFDTDLFDQRATITFSAYHKKRLNAILQLGLAPSLGNWGSQSVNVGTITGSGIEVSVSARVIERPDVDWMIRMSAASSHNAFLSAGPANATLRAAGLQLVRGYPIDGIWAYELNGYHDVNGDGIIEQNEIVFNDSASYLGSQDPNYTSTFGSTLGLWQGRLSLDAAMAYTNGMTQANTLGMASIRSRVSVQNPQLQDEAVYWSTFQSFGGIPYALYERVNTLRLQSVSLTYTLPMFIAQWFRAGAASLSLQGSNLWLHTNYSGKDPNVNGVTSGNQVADFGEIPEPRFWTLSLRLN